MSKYGKFSHGLKPRLARSCLKTFLDPKKPFGSHYGAILGLKAVGGAEVIRKLVVPNLKTYSDELLKPALEEDNGSVQKAEAEKVVAAIVDALGTMVDVDVPIPTMNGHSEHVAAEVKEKLVDKIGDVIGTRIGEIGHLPLMKAVLDSTFDFEG